MPMSPAQAKEQEKHDDAKILEMAKEIEADPSRFDEAKKIMANRLEAQQKKLDGIQSMLGSNKVKDAKAEQKNKYNVFQRIPK